MVIGGQGSGKNSVCRTLTNYTVKLGWPTLFADLDPDSNEFALTGSISVSTLTEYMGVDFYNFSTILLR